MKPVWKYSMAAAWALMVLVMVSVIAASLWRRELPVMAAAPAFELIDQDETPVTLESLRGSVWIADFIFTQCAGPCPIMTAKMAKLQQESASPNVRFVSFSVDPQRDTPAVLKEYGAKFGADPKRWKFLTGPQDAIFTTARGMMVTALPASEQNTILHSERFILIDAEGNIRRYYDSNDAKDMESLKRDAAMLAEEAAETQ